MPLSCIVFDCDGVLLESVDIKLEAFRRLAEPYGKRAEEEFVRLHATHGGVSRYEKFIWFFREFLGREITPEEAAAWNRRFGEFSDEALKNCPLVPGCLEVLHAWHGRVPLYVASGTPQMLLDEILATRGLSRYFSAALGTPPAKAALLQTAVDHAGAAPRNCVMVGDSSTDLDAAVRVGTCFYGRGERFRSSGFPWHTDLTQLNTYLEKMAAEEL